VIIARVPKKADETLAALRAKEPALHGADDTDPKVRRIGFDVLDWLGGEIEAGAHTLETGCGYSTIQFAALGAWHTVVSPLVQEHARVRAFCEQHEVSLKRVEFLAQASEDALPALGDEPLDLVLIDGAHAFPWPFLDWFYTADRLRQGGRVLVTGTELRAPRLLRDFLAQEQGRWTLVREFEKTTVFEKLVPKALESAEWQSQPWGARPVSKQGLRLRRARLFVRRVLGRDR